MNSEETCISRRIMKIMVIHEITNFSHSLKYFI